MTDYDKARNEDEEEEEEEAREFARRFRSVADFDVAGTLYQCAQLADAAANCVAQLKIFCDEVCVGSDT